MEQVAIYCRLSEEDRNKQAVTDDSGSIQNQKTMLAQYAIAQGWEIYRIYSDDDYTGSDRNRPEFKRLLQDAQARKFNIILCKTQSRFTRELELVEKYIHGLFPVWGIRFISIVDNADTANKGNKKSRQINGLVNEWYLEDMSENIRSVLTNRRQNGLHIGAFALYGYIKDPDQKGHLIIDEEAAPVVREVFTLFAQGYGKTAIARILNDRSIPNPTEYKRLHGLHYKQAEHPNSTLWKYSAIAHMLTNEMYIGNMVQGKYGSVSYKTKINKPRPREQWYRVENTHEPIIDRELWDRVQELLKQRARPFKAGNIGLFARKVRCAHCGYTMRSSKNHGRYYLTCSNRHVSKDACIGSFISVNKLEQIVLSELNRLTRALLDWDELERNICFHNETESQIAALTETLDVCMRKAEEYAHALRELYMDKVRGIISQADFVSLSEQFTREKDRLEQLILDGHSQRCALEERTRNCADPQTLLYQYTNPQHLTREMVDVLIDFIMIGRRVKGEKSPPVEIHWNF